MPHHGITSSVVDHDVAHLKLKLSPDQRHNLVEYLKPL
jgi:hypothetical protein